MNNPDISVCIATYNYGRFLKECLDSILKQSVSNYEVVVCDNFSTDNTLEVVNSYNDPRIKFFQQRENVGPQRNFNQAIKLARGKYVKLMCADDVLLPGVLEEQFDILEINPRVGVVSCDMLIADSDLKNPKFYGFYRGYMSGTQVTGECFSRLENLVGGPSNHMFRKEAIPDNPFDPNFAFLSDLKFALDVLRNWDYASINRPGNYYRRHEKADALVSCPEKVQADNWFRLVKEFDAFTLENLPRLLTMPLSAEACTEAKRRYAVMPWGKRTRAGIRRFVRRLAAPNRSSGV